MPTVTKTDGSREEGSREINNKAIIHIQVRSYKNFGWSALEGQFGENQEKYCMMKEFQEGN